MGTYLEFVAKRGCEDQINDAYAAITGDPEEWLVYSEKVIVAQIAFIHSPKGKSQAHLRRWLRTVEDWNQCFPTLRLGRGQIKLSGVREDEVQRIETIKRDVQFLLDHRMLFSCIDGLDYAREHEFCDFPLDLIENNRAKRRPPPSDPTFADLPKGRCEIYRQCVLHGRPDLWRTYEAFKTRPNENTWDELRHKVVPWHGVMRTVWQRAEQFAAQQDGKDFGLLRRFREGTIPTSFQLRAALRPLREVSAA